MYPHDGGKAHEVPPIAKKLLTSDAYWDRDSKFLSEMQALWVYPYSSDDVTPVHIQGALKKLSCLKTAHNNRRENSEGSGEFI